jgi:NAD dependent epimerase/dehydratase
MDLEGKRVLITGGTGFVGSHLAERLVRDGCSVRVLGSYKSQPDIGNLAYLDPSILNSIDIVWGDVCDRDSVLQATEGVSAIFHLAALIGIPYSYSAPDSYLRTNIGGTLNVLQAVRSRDIERLVHTSTSEVYGSAQYTPIDEKHPLVGQSPYAATKIGADKLVESFACSFELPAVTVRPFNIYGPRQSDRAIIPTIIAQRVIRKDDVRIGDPTPKRDFTFVTDTVDGFVKAASCDQAVGRTINVGSGKSISIGELANRICERTGGGQYTTDPARVRPAASEVRELLCDASQARDLLGWRAKVDLDQGLMRTIDFVTAHPENYAPGRYRV